MTPSPDRCEPVSWHSRQKHAFIEAYLSIWTENVDKPTKPAPVSLEIIDLFASWGWCRADEPGAPSDPWPGSAVLATRAACRYRSTKRLFLNTFHLEGGNTHRMQADALRAAVSEACPQPRFPIHITELPLEEAVARAEAAVDFRFPSLWLLDPYTPEQLPWTMVERVAGRSHSFTNRAGKEQTRRPEMIISFMTHALQRNLDNAPQLVSNALGLDESAWRPLVEDLRKAGLNVREAFISIYAHRLQDLYGQQPIVLEVHGVERNVVYALVFCTTHPAAQYMTLVNRMPRFLEWKQHVWRPEAKRLAGNKRIVRKEGEGAKIQRGLFEAYTPTGSDRDGDSPER